MCDLNLFNLIKLRAKQANNNVTDNRQIVGIGDIFFGSHSHQKWENSATNHAHRNKRRRLLCMRSKIFQTQTKNGWKHDAEKEIEHQ